jgi:type III secretion system YscJ/HrcJ family lipoprotein
LLRRQRTVLSLLCLWVSGCTVPVARNLDELSANRVAVALEQGGVAAAKENDGQNEGKWLISVQRADASYALGVLSREGLPTRERPGVAESVGQGSLVPSMQSEQARLLAGLAGDLERTIASIDGVASARVHLATPANDSFFDATDHAPASASVLIRHHGSELRVPTDAIRRLVAGAVSNMSAEHVVVIATQVSSQPVSQRKMASFGPFAVARESVAGLRLVAGGFVGLNLLMLVLVVVFWQRARDSASGHSPKQRPGSPGSW